MTSIATNELLLNSNCCQPVGNGMVILLFLKNKNLRTPANFLVANLAFSDLSMMLSQFPFFAYNCFSGGVWMFSPFFCELYACLGENYFAVKLFLLREAHSFSVFFI